MSKCMKGLGSMLFVVAGVMLLNNSHATGLQDIFVDALKKYAEKKAEEAGLTDNKSDAGQASAKNVEFLFTGAKAPMVDEFTFLHTTEPTPPVITGGSNFAAEQDCYNRVQNKIAWNYTGSKRWSDSNVKNLCRGTKNGAAPATCFYNAMFRGARWGKKSSHTMNWVLATQLCKGTNNANQQINCLKSRIASNLSVQKAVSACDKNPNVTRPPPVRRPPPVKLQETECFNYVQGRIAWDAAGKKKSWASGNLKRLCKGTTSKFSPGNCFNYALHKKSSWGKKSFHVMNWSKALDLCEGVSNAQKVTGCFKNSIAAGKNVNNAIKYCTRRGA